MAAKANYALGFIQLVASIVCLMACEVDDQRSRLFDEQTIWVQRFTGDLAIGGAFVEGAMLYASGTRDFRSLKGTEIDGMMMMAMFTTLSVTYHTMAAGYMVVHKSPVSRHFGYDRPVYTWRYIEWIICTPILTISGSRGASVNKKKATDKSSFLELDLLASAFNIPMCCLAAWTGSVITDQAGAWICIVLSYISHVVACWEILPFAWGIRKSYMGDAKAFMLVAFMVINTIYGFVFALSIFSGISPEAEQIFFTIGDITAKYVWAVSLTVVKDKSWKESLRVGKLEAAEEAKRNQKLMKRITEAVASVEELTSPLNLIPAPTFMRIDAEKIPELQVSYKRTGALRMLETMYEVGVLKNEGARIVFFSYECLRWARVAPNPIQLEHMRGAIFEVLTGYRWRLEDLFIWLDCFSIPQTNPFLQMGAIKAIYVFASIPDLMIIICPETIHESTKLPANSESLKKRFWCRIEQVAYYCQNGKAKMLVKRGKYLEDLPLDWMPSVCCIFDADSTCCRLEHTTTACDRESVVPPLLALYFDVYWHNQVLRTKDSARQAAWELIQNYRERMFPRTFMYKFPGGQEERDLFGDAIQRMETLIGTGALTKESKSVEDDRPERREDPVQRSMSARNMETGDILI